MERCRNAYMCGYAEESHCGDPSDSAIYGPRIESISIVDIHVGSRGIEGIVRKIVV